LYGDTLADFVAAELVAGLRRHPLRIRKPELALKECFLACDDALRADPAIR
jgi:hypothetical protein